MLPFLGNNHSRPRILTERQLSLSRHLRIAQESQCHKLVVLARLRVGKYGGNLRLMIRSQEKRHIMKASLRQTGKPLSLNLQYILTVKRTGRYMFLRKQIILRRVLPHCRERLLILKRWCCHSTY
ncbi:hypothetical protein Barb7_02843 [Bacteroidales bacterium Barb7]|nr:hypothetical protein Barb7_02843 [Bacteroidales bacterium Barb7]